MAALMNGLSGPSRQILQYISGNIGPVFRLVVVAGDGLARRPYLWYVVHCCLITMFLIDRDAIQLVQGRDGSIREPSTYFSYGHFEPKCSLVRSSVGPH